MIFVIELSLKIFFNYNFFMNNYFIFKYEQRNILKKYSFILAIYL